jgi:hypothetical protein
MSTPLSGDYVGLTLADEGALFEYLDGALNANGIVPQVSGYDAEVTPFFAWLNEEGGDGVVMAVCRLVLNPEDGLTSKPSETEYVGWDGRVSALTYPVQILCVAVKR